MCTAELTWYTLKVHNWILMKHTWWNWHAVPVTAYWNMGYRAGTLRKIGIYFILRNYWHIDVPCNISKIFNWIFFFLLNTWFRYWIVWYFGKYIMQIVHIANWCTWLAHTLCKGLIWNHKNRWAQPWLSLGFCKRFNEVENVSGNFFLTDTRFRSEILKYALFLFLALVDDTPWWKISIK